MDDIEDLLEQSSKEREEGIKRAINEEYHELSINKKEKIDKLSEREKSILLAMTMYSLRGNWSRINQREAIIHYICQNLEHDKIQDELKDKIRWNAFLLNGHYIDGRIFRDGDRRSGLSGNLSYTITGDDRSGDGWKGTYKELSEILDIELSDPPKKDKLSKLIPNDLSY